MGIRRMRSGMDTSTIATGFFLRYRSEKRSDFVWTPGQEWCVFLVLGPNFRKMKCLSFVEEILFIQICW